jgi:hypothetical protein
VSSQQRYALLFATLIAGANGVAYWIYSSRGEKSAETGEVAPTPPPAPGGDSDSIANLAQDQKRKGVAALKGSNYTQAIAAFEAAQKLDPKDPDLATLLEVARKLQVGDSEEEEAEPAAVVEAPQPRSPPVAAHSRTNRNRRDRTVRVAPPPPPPPAEEEKALLLVTTTPEKLLLEIDGRAADMTPARVEVDPGSVRVVIKRGQQVLLDRKVNAASGAVVAIQEDFTTALASVEAPAAKTDRSGIAQDDELDLVELIDRDRGAPAAARAPAPAATGQPRVVVFLPGRNGAAVEASLKSNMAGVDVEVLARSSDLKDALGKGADAVIASSAVLRDHGLTPAMRGVGAAAEAKFVAVSFNGEVQRTRLPSMTLGVVDDRGRKQTTQFVSNLIGAPKPKLRRVGKLEDLLPLLQFKMVDAVLIREADVTGFERRTEQKLFISAPLGTATESVAVAFIAGGRRQVIERAVLGLGAEAKENLGVGRWAGP